VGVVRLTGSLSLTQLLIFERQPEGLHLLSLGEVTYFLKVPLQTLTKGVGAKRNFKRGRPVHLVGLDLILKRLWTVTDTIVDRSPGIVFPIAILESCSYVLLSLNSGGSRLCVASKLFLSP
jgi:hypothetical protein